MARDFHDVLRALLSKTVARGATVHEEASAKAKAKEIAAREGIDLASLAVKRPTSFSFEFNDVDFGEMMRRAARRHAKPKAEEFKPDPKFAGTIRGYAEQLLMRKRGSTEALYSYREVLLEVGIRFPNAKTSVASLRWYESKLRKAGKDVPKRRPLR